MMTLDEETRDAAKRLAKASGYHEEYQITIVPGFTVPMWTTFISRATQLIAERKAFCK